MIEVSHHEYVESVDTDVQSVDTDVQSEGVEFGIALPMVGRSMGTHAFIEEITTEVRAAEESGFGLCLVPEHHGGPRSALTDPLATVAWLLAQTNRIKVGTGVLILPLQSIARLAEQVAILQHASGGRLVLGVGAGYQPEDFTRFGVDLGERAQLMDAGIRGLRAAWETGELDGHPIRPVGGTVPAPSLQVGAWTKAGIRRAAAVGDGWIADPIRSIEEVADAADHYRRLAKDEERPGSVTVMREGWVGDSDESAAATFGPIIEPIFRYYLRNNAFGKNHGLEESDLTLDAALTDRVLCGSVETVTARTVDLVERTGADTVVFGLRHPHGPAHTEVIEAITLLGKKVLPAVRARISERRGRS